MQFNHILAGNILHIKMMKDDFICQSKQKSLKWKKKKKKQKDLSEATEYEKDSWICKRSENTAGWDHAGVNEP